MWPERYPVCASRNSRLAIVLTHTAQEGGVFVAKLSFVRPLIMPGMSNGILKGARGPCSQQTILSRHSRCGSIRPSSIQTVCLILSMAVSDHLNMYTSLPRWQCVHFDPPHPRGRSDDVRTSLGEVVARAERRKGHPKRHLHVGRSVILFFAFIFIF